MTPEYTPVGRGFNFSYGFLEGGEDHNTSATFGNACKKGEVDLSHGQAARGPGHPAGPFPYTWPGCRWQELNNTAVHNFYNPHSVDIQGHNPWPTALDTEPDCAALCDNRIDCATASTPAFGPLDLAPRVARPPALSPYPVALRPTCLHHPRPPARPPARARAPDYEV